MNSPFDPTPPEKPTTPSRVLKTRPGHVHTPSKPFLAAPADLAVSAESAQQLFNKYDRNADGVISKAEFLDVLRELSPQGVAEDVLQQQVAAYLTLCGSENDEITFAQFSSQFGQKTRSRPDNDDFDPDVKFVQNVNIQKTRFADELKDDEEVCLFQTQ